MWLAAIKFFSGIGGKVAAGFVGVGAIIVAVAMVVAGIKKAGRNEQLVIDQKAEIEQSEKFNERLGKSLEAGAAVKRDIDSSGLRDSDGHAADDGYKRKPKSDSITNR